MQRKSILPMVKSNNVQNYNRVLPRGLTSLRRRIILTLPRGVAQLASAPRLGRGGRRFESAHPDLLSLSRVKRWDLTSATLQTPSFLLRYAKILSKGKSICHVPK